MTGNECFNDTPGSVRFGDLYIGIWLGNSGAVRNAARYVDVQPVWAKFLEKRNRSAFTHPETRAQEIKIPHRPISMSGACLRGAIDGDDLKAIKFRGDQTAAAMSQGRHSTTTLSMTSSGCSTSEVLHSFE